MWARVVEMMTAVWIAVGPFVFHVQDDLTLLWLDLGIAMLISTLASLSYWKPTQHAHLSILLVALGLIAWGRFAEIPPPPAHQNHIIVGLLLLMIALIPNNASDPPESWQEFLFKPRMSQR